MYYFWLHSVFVAAGAFLAASTGYSLVAAGRLLTPVASLVAEHGHWAWALGMWASVVAGEIHCQMRKAESGNDGMLEATQRKEQLQCPHALSDQPHSTSSLFTVLLKHSLRIYSVAESLVQETDMTGQWFPNFPVSGLLYTLLKITEDSKELLFLTYSKVKTEKN